MNNSSQMLESERARPSKAWKTMLLSLRRICGSAAISSFPISTGYIDLSLDLFATGDPLFRVSFHSFGKIVGFAHLANKARGISKDIYSACIWAVA